jgi:hypothetical protein
LATMYRPSSTASPLFPSCFMAFIAQTVVAHSAGGKIRFR